MDNFCVATSKTSTALTFCLVIPNKAEFHLPGHGEFIKLQLVYIIYFSDPTSGISLL